MDENLWLDLERQMEKYYSKQELPIEYNLGYYRGIIQSLFGLHQLSKEQKDYLWAKNDLLAAVEKSKRNTLC